MRSWWGHEQASIAATVATALHHSAQRGGDVVRRLTGTDDSGNREEVEHASHYGPRAQKTPPPGERLGINGEPGPQRSDRSPRHSSGEDLPTLSLPVLAGASGESFDASSVRYLSAAARLDQNRQRVQQWREKDQE